MGAYAPAPIVSAALSGQLIDTVIEPTLAVLRRRGHAFQGCLFGGLMLDGGQARVLEFNVRFGDPEAGAIVPLLDGSWLELLTRAATGNLSGYKGRVGDRYALSVVLAAHGYPGKVRSGDPIAGLDDVRDPAVTVLHAGTRARADGTVETAAGRVLNVVGIGPTLRDAAASAYAGAHQIRFDGMQLRHDIGARGFEPR
jgi:phosphoribosylamine--glycine ligase